MKKVLFFVFFEVRSENELIPTVCHTILNQLSCQQSNTISYFATITVIFPSKVGFLDDYIFKADFISLIIGKKFSLMIELLSKWFIGMYTPKYFMVFVSHDNPSAEKGLTPFPLLEPTENAFDLFIFT